MLANNHSRVVKRIIKFSLAFKHDISVSLNNEKPSASFNNTKLSPINL
jgi:hypothetical protein